MSVVACRGGEGTGEAEQGCGRSVGVRHLLSSQARLCLPIHAAFPQPYHGDLRVIAGHPPLVLHLFLMVTLHAVVFQIRLFFRP